MSTDTPFKPTRRRFLTRAAQAASVAAASTLMPPNVQKLLAAEPRGPRSLKDIKHVVLLMMENRSFDHYFGTLSGVRGFGDPNALVMPNGRNVFHQPDAESADGYMLPFHLDSKRTNAQSMPSTSHAWAVQHRAWNGGRMDQWLPAHRAADGADGPYTMGYFTREDIPFHYALADAFTICDGYHCSVMGPTRPNRLYWMTGMIDPESRHGGAVIANGEFKPGSRSWTTYPERLEEAGISWKFYQHAPKEFGFNMLHGFRQYKEAPKSSPLVTKGLTPVSEGTFEYDALNDRLPTVSWIGPTEEASEHPVHMPAAGAAFIASKLDAIAANPDVWAKTVFIINYDENDGLFDHVPPPVPAAGEPLEFINDLPIGGGFRVPCIIVSPWTVGGWVCSQPFDHTSVLQFLERFTGVREPNITDWRRRTFGDLTSAFRFGDRARAAPRMPETKTELERALHASANLPPPALSGFKQKMPKQERGSRKRISLDRPGEE
jgi:phospholipase C